MLNKLPIAVAAALLASAALADSPFPSSPVEAGGGLMGTPAHESMPGEASRKSLPADGQDHLYDIRAEQPSFTGTAARSWPQGRRPFPVTPDAIDG